MRGKKIKDLERISVKERNLIKGSLRRLFARSDLRRQAIALTVVPGYVDAARPRVTKWSRCTSCKNMTPTYLMDIDHVIPLVPLESSLEDMTLDELVERLWCPIENLQGLCKKPCHHAKGKIEAKERARHRKIRKAKQKAC